MATKPRAARSKGTEETSPAGKGRVGDGSPGRTPVDTEVLDEIRERQERIRSEARGILGVTGGEDSVPLKEGVTDSGVGWYPLMALGALVVVDEFQSYGFFVLAPEISRSLGISKSVLGVIIALKLLAITLATLPMAAFVQRKPRRGILSIIAAFFWGLMQLFTGFVANVWGLVAVLVADGASSGSVRAIHPSLLMDTYPPSVRVRTFSFYRAADSLGNIIAPLMVGLLTAVLGFTWRGVFIVMGLTSLLAAFASLRLRDPGFGRWDTDRVRQVVRREEDSDTDAVAEEEVSLGFFEIVRRVYMVPTVRRVLVTWAIWGMFLVPLQTFIFFFLEERWNMGPGARSLFFAGMPLFAIPTLTWFGRRGEALFRRDPARLVDLTALVMLAVVVGVLFGVIMPIFPGMLMFFGLAFAGGAVMIPAMSIIMLSVVPPAMRAHAAALGGIALAGVGGMGGLLLLGGIDRRFGVGVAVASLSVPGILAALSLRAARKTASGDLDRLIDEIVEDEEIRTLKERGVHLPMLAARHIDFSYGQLQVLFDVDFSVEEGEMVALLGTNGAGKSTLLRVISGLGLPTHGRVHYRGADITYLDAERRLGLGITQVPGGRAVFPSLTVVENLRVYGFTHAKDRATVDRGIDATFEAFDALAARRNQPASTLSGGEQQMLGLGKAFILKPKLLLIDELSLGLAPIIVSQLLEMVRQINTSGTAVVLVEQSVNIALSLVDHAYFMEKGEMRFDGSAQELLRRPDLLRSVFLEGAAKTLS